MCRCSPYSIAWKCFGNSICTPGAPFSMSACKVWMSGCEALVFHHVAFRCYGGTLRLATGTLDRPRSQLASSHSKYRGGHKPGQPRAFLSMPYRHSTTTTPSHHSDLVSQHTSLRNILAGPIGDTSIWVLPPPGTCTRHSKADATKWRLITTNDLIKWTTSR